MTERIVFACSGSPENLAALPVLAERLDADIVALTLDVGQGRELEAVRSAALTAGAVRAHVLDVRDEFARDCIRGFLRQTGSSRLADQPVSRSLIAGKLIEMARLEDTATIAHAGDARDHAEIEAAALAIDPTIRVINVEGTPPPASVRGVRTTLWGRVIDGESPLPVLPGRMPDAPAHLEISFEGGLPVAVNGVPMAPAELVESVATIAGHHGVGRLVDGVTGASCDAPAAVVLHAMHEALGDDVLETSGATVCLELFQGHHRVLSAHHS